MTLFLKEKLPSLADAQLDMIKNGTISHQLEQMEGQLPNFIVLGLAVVTAAYIVRNCRMKDFWIVILAYFLTDAYMAALHVFLDHPKTSGDCPVPMLAAMAKTFQHHHKYPFDVLYMNHVGAIDELNIFTLGFPWVWRLAAACKGTKLPAQIHLLAFSSSAFGILAAFNHVCMHARTHHQAVPPAIEWGQDMGLLPRSEFHRKHHTPPHDENYAFLVGGSAVYDQLNTMALQSLSGVGVHAYYYLLAVLFWALQPFNVSSFVAAWFWLRNGKNGNKIKSA